MATSLGKRLLDSALFGAAITAASALPIPQADTFLRPGELLSSLFWPEGIHSDFSGPASVVAMLIIVWAGAWLAWSALAYTAALAASRMRRSA